jgi:hypothetical protein
MAGSVQTTPSEIADLSQSELMTEIQPENVTTKIPKMPALTIDPEFKGLIPPLTDGERAALKESIETHGCQYPLIVWKNIILDGHHRYEICIESDRPFKTIEMEFPDRNEAKIWIIKNPRGRRNLNESQRAMLAVTLEALYGEQAKVRQGTRTDLGQNLDRGEAERSAEKAAKDMGVSHQTVSFAKKVATKGVPELKQLVNSSELAVSTAATVADLSAEDQNKVQIEIQKKADEKKKAKISSRVTSSEVARIIRELRSREKGKGKPDIDKNIGTVENRLRGIMKILTGIETTAQQEKLFDLIKLSEDIISQVKAIGLRSPVPERKVEVIPGEYQLEINAKTLKIFLESVVPSDKGVKLRFDGDGLRIDQWDNNMTIISSAFMPRGYFSKYEIEPCEVCLRRIQDLSRTLWEGNIQIFIEPETTYHHDRVMKIYSGYEDGGITREDEIQLTRPEYLREDSPLPELDATCKLVVSISSEDFVGSLRDIKRTKYNDEKEVKYARLAELSVEDSSLKIVAHENMSTQRIPCNVLVQGEAASEFNLASIVDGDVGRVIQKSNMITLGLGKNYPMIMDLTLGKMEIRYMLVPRIEKDLSHEYEIYRGVLVDGYGNPVMDDPGDQNISDQETSETQNTENENPSETKKAENEGNTEAENTENQKPVDSGQDEDDETTVEDSQADSSMEEGNLEDSE